MGRLGFIKGSLDVKLLVLYIMSRVAEPIVFDALIDLALCDEGIDYFQLSQAVSELVESEHLIRLDDGKLIITEKGRSNGRIMEDNLPTVIRGRCNRNLAKLNASLRFEAQMSAQVVTDELNRCHIQLGLVDGTGSLLQMSLAVPDEDQGNKMVHRFREEPEAFYQMVLSYLLEEKEKTVSPESNTEQEDDQCQN